MKGFMYILKCSNDLYYVGSTNDLEKRIEQHNAGEGASYTRKHRPVKLVYFEEFQKIDDAFYREQQVKGWSRAKKEALINNNAELLPCLSKSSAWTVSELVEPPALRQAQGPERAAKASVKLA